MNESTCKLLDKTDRSIAAGESAAEVEEMLAQAREFLQAARGFLGTSA